MADAEGEFLEQFGDEEKEALSGLEFAVFVGRFYEDLADRLLTGAPEGFEGAGGAAQAPTRLAGSHPRARWPRYGPAGARDRPSASPGATRWSRPSGASIRSCRRCGSRRTGGRCGLTSARVA